MASTTKGAFSNSHCSGCGMSQLAVREIVQLADGTWKCSVCVHRNTVSGASYTAITCPVCRGGGGTCPTCSGLGKVRVETSRLRIYTPTAARPLTEG